MKNRFWGSTSAIVVGVLSMLGGLSQLGSGEREGGDSFTAGLLMLLGALAYRSLKRRRLGLKPDGLRSQVTEAVLLLIAILIIILQNNLLDRLYSNPLLNVIIPVWVILAYVIVLVKKNSLEANATAAPRNWEARFK